ncbi:uncharacterized protein LOC117010259 [Catharus ustulatus]|uniref:uncharacterized protein LOC117010259 n=1 Tax=Catharus ustulatus TaxID=91951 RepID=UPI00140815C7|nr:uncharacterized protein LOC117010259 [Catharus ustulatus]
MAGRAPSKDTQEEKPRLNQTDLPSCLKLDVLTKELWSNKDLKNSLLLSCLKLPNVKDPGEEPTCPSYTCISAPTRRNCSTIRSSQTYQPIQCPEAGQEMQQEMQQKLQQEMQQGHKCRAKSTEDFKDIDLCCSPEVLEKATLEMEKLLANEKQQLITTDPQEANLDHQTPKTPRDHRTFPRTSRRFQEWHNSGDPAPMLDHPTPNHIPLCLGTSPGYQPPGLGQESSQGWVIAVGTLVPLVFLVFLVFLGLRWWKGRKGRRGRREKRCSNGEALKAEEGLEEKEDEDEM